MLTLLKNKRTYAIIGGVVLLTLLIFGLSSRTGRAQSENETGEQVTVMRGDLSAEATATGTVQPRREASLSLTTPGLVTAVSVRPGDVVETGDVLVTLDTVDLALNVTTTAESLALREAQLADLLAPPDPADVAAAEAAVAAAQASLDDLVAGPRPEQIAISEAGVRASEASLASASADLSATRDSVTESQIKAAEASLISAQIQRDEIAETNADNPNAENHQAMLEAEQAVADAQAQLDSLLDGPDLDASQSNVNAANARLASSQADLNALLAAATAAELAQARQQLAQAEASLADLVEPPTAAEIASAEAEVAQARLTLADAEDALADATLTAPFAGVVTAVNFSEGELASGVVVQLVDTTSFEVILAVDEVDVGELAVGQTAVVTLEAWPDTEIDGQITTIAPGAATDPGTALVTYDVHLALGETELHIRVGMTANANLVTAQREDILLVPNAAINADRSAGLFSVNLVTGETITEVPVTIGLRDGQFTQIISGVDEGDVLLITNGIPLETFEGGPPQ